MDHKVQSDFDQVMYGQEGECLLTMRNEERLVTYEALVNPRVR